MKQLKLAQQAPLEDFFQFELSSKTSFLQSQCAQLHRLETLWKIILKKVHVKTFDAFMLEGQKPIFLVDLKT